MAEFSGWTALDGQESLKGRRSKKVRSQNICLYKGRFLGHFVSEELFAGAILV